MGNAQGTSRNMVHSLSDLDGSFINQGTSDVRQPQLAFHSVHGQNVELKKGTRIARRRESFCKGLAFSNRPIGIEENVCIRLTEVATNWSGVLRFGVCNVDPETFRNCPVPKFACPDLTSKEGYWAKALPERYSVEGNILHFHVTSEGELFYGINGTQKGVFLVGINTSLPLWIIIDIYGNSVAVEFVDPAEFDPSRSVRPISVVPRITNTTSHGIANPSHDSSSDFAHMTRNQTETSGSSRSLDLLRFHFLTGRHVSLNSGRCIAERSEQEYTQGYVFTERPIPNNEKVVIQVLSVQNLYNGGLAFGVTCCDPATLRAVDLPDDSSDLIEFPDYWVGIKDIALQPKVFTILSFWITDAGEVKFEKDNGGARTVLHVDNTLPLYFWFDCYGSTQSIKMLGSSNITRSQNRSAVESRSVAGQVASTRTGGLPVLPNTTRRVASTNSSNVVNLNRSEALSTQPLRVDLRSSTSPAVSRENGDSDSRPRNVPPLPPRRTVDDLLGPIVGQTSSHSSSGPSTSTSRLPPPVATRTAHSTSSLSSLLPTPPSRPPPPTPFSFTSSRPSSTTAPISTLPAAPTIPAPPVPAYSPNYEVPKRTVSASAAVSSKSEKQGEDVSEEDECTVCMSARINSVIYTCGHMCMCYECATQTFKNTGQCPLCRCPIKDVIKCFR